MDNAPRRQLCGLKFRRQHPIGPFFVDFACCERKLVVEIDGEYHNHVVEQGSAREKYIQSQGWAIFRVTAEQVRHEPEGVAILNASHLEFCLDKYDCETLQS